MPEHPPRSPLGAALIAAGFLCGAREPDRALYIAEVAGSQDVLLTLTDETVVLRTFLAPVDAVGYRQVDGARSRYDGYVLGEFDGSWSLTERTSDYLEAEFPGWADAAPALPVDEIAAFLTERTVAIGRYGIAVSRRLSVVRGFIGSPELTAR